MSKNKIQATRIYAEIQKAKDAGYTTVSEQGSSRSSKTYNTVIWIVLRCLLIPKTTVSVVRATLPAIKGSVFRDFKEIMLRLDVWSDKCMNKSELIYSFPNGSWIEFFSCDNEQKIRGRKRKILYVNEGNELKFIEWQQLQMRTTEFSIIDYNPSFTDDHWLCTLNKEKGTYHFITTYKDNPFLEQKVIDEIESLQWKNPSLWRVYGLGLQAIIEGLIFDKVEYVEEIPYWAKRRSWLGMDLGYTNDPTAIVHVCFYDNTLYLDEVCYQTKMLSSDIIYTIKNKNQIDKRQYKIISESADPRMIDEIYNAGIDIHPVHKFGGSIMAGIQKMQEFRICITKRSTNLIKEFKNYTYRQDKEGKWLNEPIDSWNHCFVGDTLISTINGLKRIDEICVGDSVLTSNGYRNVLKVFDNGVKVVNHYTIQLNNNITIEVTSTNNHLIKTEKGWKKISELMKGDVVYLDVEAEEQILKAKSSMVKSSTNIKTKDTFQKETEGCIVSYGNIISETSRQASMFTTKMAIRQTTQLTICAASKQKNILANTLKCFLAKMALWKNCKSEWIMPESMHLNGIEAQRVERGTDNMGLMLQKKYSQKSSFVNYAGKSLCQRKEIQNSAPTTVSQNIEDAVGLTMLNENVASVDKNLQQINIPAKRHAQRYVVESLYQGVEKSERVYDLMIDETHEYFANGILVHNCIDAIRYVVLEELLGGYGQGLSAEEVADIL